MRRIGILGAIIIVAATSLVLDPVRSGSLRVGEAGSAIAAEDPETIRRKFEAFAMSWMGKLRERQRFNQSKVKWRPSGSGVEAIFIGYDTENYRVLPLSNVETHPIGKLVYLELKLRWAGGSAEEAQAQAPQIVERVEVTELFRYDGNKWIY